jgi:hypothetical protein
MRSYKVQTSLLVLLTVTTAAPFAHADKKDDLYIKGNAAVNAGDSIGARDAFCQLAKDDPEYKDAKAQCGTYTAEATRTLNRYNQNYLEGLQLMQDGKYDQAEFKFRNVKPPSPRVTDAQGKLGEIVKLKEKANADAAAAKNNADQDAQMKGKLDQGVDAYNRGDFNAAKSSLGAITGKYQGDAQNYLTKIRNYENKMAEAAADAASNNFTAAATAYAEAVRLNPSGPGDPLGQVGKMNQLAAKASSAPPVTAPANNPPPVIKAATKDVVKTVDVEQSLAEGKKALAKGNFKRARVLFGLVLGQDSHNQEATDGLAELKTRDTTQAVASDEDPLLANLIRGFYAGNYSDVEPLLNDYVYASKGKKFGLANFYAGASMLSRYYLTGASDETLRREAKKKFNAASKVEGFKVPEKFISPKILKEYTDATKGGA